MSSSPRCSSVSPDSKCACERDLGHGGKHQNGDSYWSYEDAVYAAFCSADTLEEFLESAPAATPLAALREKAERPIVYPLKRNECLALIEIVEEAIFVRDGWRRGFRLGLRRFNALVARHLNA